MFGLNAQQTWDDNFKEVTVPGWDMTPRQMFQKLGTDAAHPVFGKDVWMKRWFISYDLIKDTDNVVVPDVRYDLEARGIQNLGGKIIRIERDAAGLAGVEGAHSSEAGLTVDPDFIINNNGSLDDLRASLLDILESL
jgi:hypothetical protein